MAEKCSSSLKAMRVKVARRSHPYSRPDPHRLTEVEDSGSPRSMEAEAEAVRDPDPREDPGSHRLTDVEDPGSPRPMEAEAVRDPDPLCPLEGEGEAEAVLDPDSETPESPRQSEVEAVSDSAYLALFEDRRPPKPPPRPEFSSLDVQVVGHFDIRRHCVVVDGCPVPASTQQLRLMDQLNSIKAHYSALKSKERKVQDDLHHLESHKSFTTDAIIRSKRIAKLTSLLPRFVKEIEQADSYFDFKQAAKTKHITKIESEHMSLHQITHIFRHDHDLMSTLNMHTSLESQNVVQRVADAIRSELCARKHDLPKLEDPLLQEPIYSLVLQVREQDILNAPEPGVVLEKIMKSNPSLYDNLFFTRAPMEDSTSHGAHVKAGSGAQCASSARISWSSQNGPSKVVYLEKKLMNLLDAVAEAQVEERELNNEMNKLLVEMHQTEKAIYKLKRRATLSSAVPKFVEKIERANCYFDYKEAAKGKYEQQIDVEAVLPYQICRRLLKDTDLKSNFDKIDETDIRRAAFAIYSELKKNNYHQPGQESKQLDNKLFVKMKDLTLQEPLYKLVFETREQTKFMDKNPEVELEKIMETNPTLYDACFINGQPGKHLATYEEALKWYSEFWSKYVDKRESDAGSDLRSINPCPLPAKP